MRSIGAPTADNRGNARDRCCEQVTSCPTGAVRLEWAGEVLASRGVDEHLLDKLVSLQATIRRPVATRTRGQRSHRAADPCALASGASRRSCVPTTSMRPGPSVKRCAGNIRNTRPRTTTWASLRRHSARTEEAARFYTAALALAPRDDRLHFNLGNARILQNDGAGASRRATRAGRAGTAAVAAGPVEDDRPPRHRDALGFGQLRWRTDAPHEP